MEITHENQKKITFGITILPALVYPKNPFEVLFGAVRGSVGSAPAASSGVYICKSVVNDLKHGNYICKSEAIYLTYKHRIKIPVEFRYVNQ